MTSYHALADDPSHERRAAPPAALVAAPAGRRRRVGERQRADPAGRSRRIQAGVVEATASWGVRRVSVVGSSFAHGRRGRFIVLGFPAGETLPGPPAALELRSKRRRVSIDPRALEGAGAGLDAMLTQLADLDPQTREAVRERIVAGDATSGRRRRFFARQGPARDPRGAAQPLPRGAYERDETRVLWVDKLFALDDRAFLIEGWTLDEDRTFASLTVFSPEGQEVELEDVFRLGRPDVEEQLGEAGPLQARLRRAVRAARTESPGAGWIVQWPDPAGGGVERRPRRPTTTPSSAGAAAGAIHRGPAEQGGATPQAPAPGARPASGPPPRLGRGRERGRLRAPNPSAPCPSS